MKTLCLLVISQSGELPTRSRHCVKQKSSAHACLAICNVQGSMIVREADGTILTHAALRLVLLRRKLSRAQMIALYLLGMYLGQVRGVLSVDEARFHAQELAELPVKLEHLLNDSDGIEELSKEFFRSTDFLYLGRGINFPVALEGALKLKENFVHSRRRLSGRRDEAWSKRVD
jgi:glucosamine--fructose-6-phosphate aminotransferase (isomerizing)